MARFAHIILLGMLWFFSPVAEAMFMIPDLKEVPIERLLTNLQTRLTENTNSWSLNYQLARLHAMAYATNKTIFTVEKKTGDLLNYPLGWVVPPEVFNMPARKASAMAHLSNAITYYERSIVLIKKFGVEGDDDWGILPCHLGLAGCLDQAGRREDAINAYRKTLKLAWKNEVDGTFKFSEWIKDAYQDARSGQNPLRSKMRGFIGPGLCYSEETIGYLLKILDPVKDAREISRLQKNLSRLNSMGRAFTPILIALGENQNLADLVDPTSSVSFDLDGSGLPRKWSWITPKAAWLVFDPHQTGRITSALQMFGNVTFWIFWRDGYEALASLDDNNDGVLRGPELAGLALWHDANSDGVSDPGEVRPLKEFGITGLRCRGQSESSHGPWNPQGVDYQDGRTAPTYDWIATSPPVVAAND